MRFLLRNLERILYQRRITLELIKEAEGDPNLEKYYRSLGHVSGVLAQIFAEAKRDYPTVPIDSLSFVPINPYKIQKSRSEYFTDMKAFVRTRPPRMAIGIVAVDDDCINFEDELVSYVQGENIGIVLGQDYTNNALGEKGRRGKTTLIIDALTSRILAYLCRRA